MEFALNFLQSNVGIESPALLSSPFLLVTLAYFAHVRDYRITPEECDRLRFWALLANAKGRYSRGSSETILDQDLTTLKQVGGAPDLIDRLRLQVGRLDITPDELEGRNQRSALFKTMFLAFRAAGAKDWRSNLAIALDHTGTQHRLQFHHIFPKAVLKSSYGKPTTSPTWPSSAARRTGPSVTSRRQNIAYCSSQSRGRPPSMPSASLQI
jgi:hypothetical protein